MKVFISWSGQRSQDLANFLRDWLKSVLQCLDPWLSTTDIRKGSRWSQEVSSQLSDTAFGLLCVTPENLLSPWILFEAGAISKSLQQGRVCPYLLGLEPSDLEGPLAQFQATRSNRDDTLQLIKTLNEYTSHGQLSQDILVNSFDMRWEDLDSFLQKLRCKKPEEKKDLRPDRELLSEAVDRLRYLTRSVESKQSSRKRGRIDPDIQDNKGDTALMLNIRCANKSEDLTKRQQILRILLDAGADPNISSNDGKSPLDLAREKGLTEMVKMLEDSGAVE